jgi:HEAT repeat protein
MRKRLIYSLSALAAGWLLWVTLTHLAANSLIHALRQDEVAVALHAEILGYVPGGRRAAVAALLAALEDESPHVRWNAGYGLGLLRPREAEVVPALARLLRHADPGVRWNAAFVLGELGPEAETAVPALIDAFDDERAGEVLCGGGYQSAQRAYELRKQQSVRSAAAEALGKVGPPPGAPSPP